MKEDAEPHDAVDVSAPGERVITTYALRSQWAFLRYSRLRMAAG